MSTYITQFKEKETCIHCNKQFNAVHGDYLSPALVNFYVRNNKAVVQAINDIHGFDFLCDNCQPLFFKSEKIKELIFRHEHGLC